MLKGKVVGVIYQRLQHILVSDKHVLMVIEIKTVVFLWCDNDLKGS